MTRTVDQLVYDLAYERLSEKHTPDQQRVMDLAIRIQTAIEAYEAEQADRDEELRALKGYTDDEKARI